MAEPRPLNRLGVVGGGPVALLAAIALARALPTSDVFLLPCAVPEAALADHAVSGGAALRSLHARIGIGERLLLARAAASHCLAIHVEGIGAQPDFWLGHGAAVRDAAGGFAGEPSLATVLAEAERFLDPGAAGGDLIDPVLRFDPAAYRAGLTMLARQARVRELAPAAGLVGEGGIALADGTHFEADLLIDATGTGWVRSAAGQSGWTEADGPARSCRGSTAAQMSLRDRLLGRGGAFLHEQPGLSATTWTGSWEAMADEHRVLDAFASAAGAIPDPVFSIAPGRLATAWQGRVVAIGEAAARFAPTAGLNLHLAAAQILLLLDLLPCGTPPFVETAEYNRRSALLAQDALDFVACLHGGIRSPALAQRIDQFARRGWVPVLAEGCVSVDLWAQLLAGLGHGPGKLPRRTAMPEAEAAAAAAARARTRATRLAGAVPYARWRASQA